MNQSPASIDLAPYYDSFLHELIEAGADAARMVAAHAKAPSTKLDSKTCLDTAAAFDHASRAVRRAILLSRKLSGAEPPKGVLLNPAAGRRRIIRAVDDVITRCAMGGKAHRPSLRGNIGDRPVPEIIADICRDLGLAVLPGTLPWKRGMPADLARLCARAAGQLPGKAEAVVIPFQSAAPPRDQRQAD